MRLDGQWRRLAAGALLAWAAPMASAAERLLQVPPALLDARVAEADPPHGVLFDDAQADQPLLVWLSGTGGRPLPGPQALFQTVRQQGYRLISLSFHTTPAVAQVCVAARLRLEPDCAQQFRQQRVWGDAPTPLIGDQAQDAIVPRLARLLQHLAHTEPTGQWQQFLDGDAPRWSRIVLAGQSQGGGMAAFLAQTQPVAGVLMFSGGWDHGPGGTAAAWYRRPSATEPARWHSTHHAEEPQAAQLSRIDALLAVPEAQRHRLQAPVLRNAHTEGVGNPVYQPLWVEILMQLRP